MRNGCAKCEITEKLRSRDRVELCFEVYGVIVIWPLVDGRE